MEVYYVQLLRPISRHRVEIVCLHDPAAFLLLPMLVMAQFRKADFCESKW